MSFNNIYQEIYDADISSASGIPAIFTGNEVSETVGYVTVTEAKDSSRVEDVLQSVSIPESKKKSYQLAEALFDNYDLQSSIPDDITTQEAAEVDELLAFVVQSTPMQLARGYIQEESGKVFSDASWYARVKETWFRPFTVGSSPTRSGFEHVFLGEAKGGKVGGLHWWYFYFNKMQQIDYKGAVYSNVEQGLSVPELVTMTFTWNAGGQALYKKIGGFFVGLSVEGLMAMGMVRAADEVDAPSVVVLQGAEVDLKMFKSSDRRSVNTFYPVFKRVVSTVIKPSSVIEVNGSGNKVDTKIETKIDSSNKTASSAIRLIGALANPDGLDEGRESVTMMNISKQRALLSGWSVIGPNGSKLMFGDFWLESGEARTVVVPAKGGLQLSNKGGEIKVADAMGNVVQKVVYDRSDAKMQGGVFIWNGTDKLVIAA